MSALTARAALGAMLGACFAMPVGIGLSILWPTLPMGPILVGYFVGGGIARWTVRWRIAYRWPLRVWGAIVGYFGAMLASTIAAHWQASTTPIEALLPQSLGELLTNAYAIQWAASAVVGAVFASAPPRPRRRGD